MKKGQKDRFGITERELKVIEWVAEGFSNPEIARELFIERTTVATHIVNAALKLGIRGHGMRVKLAVWYVRNHDDSGIDPESVEEEYDHSRAKEDARNAYLEAAV